MAMGISPIFVRFAEVGPFTSAFWRVGLALPALWLWARLERAAAGTGPRRTLRHASRSSPPACFSPAISRSGTWPSWKRRSPTRRSSPRSRRSGWCSAPACSSASSVERKVFLGLALCLVGAAALIGDTWSINPGQLDGDLYGIATSFFFGAYFLAVRRARRVYGSGRTLFLSTHRHGSCASGRSCADRGHDVAGRPSPASPRCSRWRSISHSGGQGLLAFALGHLPAAFSALVIFLEAVAAAFFGWLILGEALGPVQARRRGRDLCRHRLARPRRRA